MPPHVRALVARCMVFEAWPVTTTTEEVLWIAEWCHRHHALFGWETLYPTVLVGDPICFIQIGKDTDSVPGLAFDELSKYWLAYFT
jgi:hypothetical protein